MILPPAASAPPAVVVNENVAAAPVFAATRSPLDTAKETEQTELELQICPDAVPTDAVGSALVDMVMPDEPAVGMPVIRPVSVTVTAVLAESVAVPVVMTMDAVVGAVALPVAPPLTATAGVALVAKKPDGY